MKPPKGLFVAPASFGILATLLSVALARMPEACPGFCICDMWLKLRRAACVNKNLYSVQTGLPAIVQALDLSNNSVSSLGNFELANIGLTRLKYLNLSGNSINEIDLNAFTALDDLAVLDLSRNHLYYVLEDTFANSKSLKILRLDENNFNSDIPRLRSSYIK
ncbi:trophoblast glycoprotein-like, partial [Cephus cinctus]|uniref:Trophoblast glycoprotein-like n=1 Tax=Cephus cinctus TaxID=211228 RepID=A0AAJ7FUH6_CEPCN